MNTTLRIEDPAIQSLVCEHCWQQLFTYDAFQSVWTMEETPDSKGYSYTTTWESMRESIGQGCNWCNLLSSRAKTATGECTISVASSTEAQKYTPAGIKKLTVKYHGKDGSFNSGFGYRLYTTSDDNASQIIRARDRVLELDTPSSYKLALECLDRCINFHDKCPKPVEQCLLPDRVIDCSNLEQPKIVITSNTLGAYATLSYVWGKKQNLVATTKNIDSFINEGLEVELLPPTIQHALKAAHDLGMQYLWIDALCILQDSAEDKGRQIAQMHRIYTNSYFTIIAACANGVDEGFLQDRPARVPSGRIPFICPDGKVGTVCLASTEMIGYDVTKMYHDEMEPVNYRGWCLQERVLSKRSFIFASDTIKYYCQTETVNIGDALCEPSTGPRLPEAFTTASAQDLSPDELMWARRSWLFMIWEYTRRSLTRPDEDKLNAMAGIAEQYYHIWQAKYYAGLWEHTFLEDLMWKRGAASEGPTERSTTYRAPTWSWASVDGHTDAPNFESQLTPGAYNIGRCRIVECNVTPGRQDSPFAAVIAAYLKLEVYLHEVVLKQEGSSKTYFKIFLQSTPSAEGRHIGSVGFDCLEDITIISPAYVAPVFWDRGQSFVQALVLATSAGGHFRRLGRFSLEGKGDWVENAEKKIIAII